MSVLHGLELSRSSSRTDSKVWGSPDLGDQFLNLACTSKATLIYLASLASVRLIV